MSHWGPYLKIYKENLKEQLNLTKKQWLINVITHKKCFKTTI